MHRTGYKIHTIEEMVKHEQSQNRQICVCSVNRSLSITGPPWYNLRSDEKQENSYREFE